MKNILFLISMCLVYFVGLSQNTKYKLYIHNDESDNSCLIYYLSLNDIQISNSTHPPDYSILLSDSDSISVYFLNLNEEELYLVINELPDEIALKVKEIYISFSCLNTNFDIATLLRFKNVELLNLQNCSGIEVKLKLLLNNIEELCKLEKIVSLSLSNVTVNKSFKMCCFENLEYLDVSFSNIAMDGQLLQNCSNLKHIVFGNSNNKLVSAFISEIAKQPTLNEITLIVQNSKQIQLLSHISSIEKINLIFGFPLSEMKLDKAFVSLAKIENLKSLHINSISKFRVIKKISDSIQKVQDIEELSIDFPLLKIDNLLLKNLKLLRLYRSNLTYLQDGQLEAFKKINHKVEIIIENDVFKLTTPVN